MTLVDPVDVAAIAQRLAVVPRTVHVWRQRYDSFPAPAQMFAMGPVWEWNRVLEWADATGRNKERPPTE